jgi:hypothetical protein
MTRYQRLRRALARRPVNRFLTDAELRRAARARQAVEQDRDASELSWGWIARVAVVVIPLTLLAQALVHRLGCITC